MFVINGQTNGNLPTRFFSAKGLKYENISNNILVLVDCSEVEPNMWKNYFRIIEKEFLKIVLLSKLKKNLRDHLNDHEGLKTFQNDWRKNEIESLNDLENIKDLFEKLLKN